MVRLGIALLNLLLLLAVAERVSAAKTEFPLGPTNITLLRGVQNHLLVPAHVNGHDATFLLDTGEDIDYLQRDRAQPLGVQSLGRQARSGNRWFELGEIANLHIGSLALTKVEIALYDPAQFHGPVPGRKGKPADGILGLKFLRQHKAIVNCRTQQLYLQTGPASPLDLSAITRELGFTRVPLIENEEGALTVPCSFKGKRGNLVLDTGAFVTVFDQKSMRDFELKESATKLSARTPSGRVRPLQVAQFDNLRIGGLPVAPQKFAVMDLFAAIKPVRTSLGINRIQVYDARTVRVKRNVLGLLGSELLYQRSAIIDVGRLALYLK
ncbi:MAG: aspartyl protease family protein [Chthoniobacterales bacterium]|nr:aspartyl protease family protein [Chthoniobacterales bacterium]